MFVSNGVNRIANFTTVNLTNLYRKSKMLRFDQMTIILVDAALLLSASRLLEFVTARVATQELNVNSIRTSYLIYSKKWNYKSLRSKSRDKI